MSSSLDCARGESAECVVNTSDIVIRKKWRKGRPVKGGGLVRVCLLVGKQNLEQSWGLMCRDAAAVEYVRDRLSALMSELDGVRVE